MKIAYIKSHTSMTEFKLDEKAQNITKVTKDLTDLKETSYSLIIFSNNEENLVAISGIIEHESKFCPVVPDSSLGLDLEKIESLECSDLLLLNHKITKSWVLKNNLSLIENNYKVTNHLKDLWQNDRNSFFEELWFILKTNLATSKLEIIFHDLKEPTDAQKEKGAKAELMYAVVKGNKTQQIFEAKELESKLMQEYKNEFNTSFEITDYSREKNELVITSKIKLSPILILAKLADFNSIQQALFKGIFESISES